MIDKLRGIKGKIFFCILGVLMSLVCFLLIPKLIVKTDFFCQSTEIAAVDSGGVAEIGESHSVATQSFVASYDNLKSLGVKVALFNQTNHGKITCELLDEKEKVLAEKIIDLLYVEDNAEVEFAFDHAVQLEEETYYVRFSVETENDYKVGLYYDTKAPYPDGTLMMDEEEIEGDLYLIQYGYNNGADYKMVYFIFLSIFMVLIMLMLHESIVKSKFDEITCLDWIFCGAAILSCCLLFNQAGDMIITIKHSKDLLHVMKNGQILEFYHYVLDKALLGKYGVESISLAANYNIFLYLILAVIMFPFFIVTKLFSITYSEYAMLTYYNIILALGILFSAYLVYRIVEKFSIKENKKCARNTVYLYLTSLVLLNATVGFSQLDIFYIIIMLFSILKLQQGKMYWFSFIMSISIMLKSFPILIFIPILLIYEKKIGKIILNLLIGVSSPLIVGFLLKQDAAYSYTQQRMQGIYQFKERLVYSQIDLGMGGCALFILLYVLLVIYCYDKDLEKEQKWKAIVAIPVLVFSGIMIFVGWHPQWIAIIAPFLAMSIGIGSGRRSKLLCEWALGLVYCLTSFWKYEHLADNTMISRSIFGELMNHNYNGITIAKMINSNTIYPWLLLTVFYGLNIYFCYSLVQDLKVKTEDLVIEDYDRWMVLGRCASVFGIIIVFLTMYFYVG